MSSLDSDDVMSTSLPVAKLVKHYFDKLGDVLTNRENSFKREIENLKSVGTLLDRNGDQLDLERLQYEERLGKKQRECQRLKEKVIRLIEEKGKLTDRVEMVDKKSDTLFMENLKMENVKNNLISELGKCKSKCQELEAVVTQLTDEKMTLSDDVKMANKKCDMISVENMKMENEKSNIIYELGKSKSKCQELEAAFTRLTVEKAILTDHVNMLEDMNFKMRNEKNDSIFELNEKINELKNKILESERLAGVYQEKSRCLGNKIVEMDKEIRQRNLEFDQVVEELKLANKSIEDLKLEKIGLDKKVELFKSMLQNSSERIKTIEKNFSRMSTMMVGDMTTLINDVGELGTFEMRWNLDSRGLCGRNENSLGNANVDVASPSNGSRNNRLSREGDRNSHQPCTGEDDTAHNVPTLGSNEFIDPLGSAARDIKEILDNDETNHAKAESSKRVLCSDERNLVKRRKRSRTENMGEEGDRTVDKDDRVDCSSSVRFVEEARGSQNNGVSANMENLWLSETGIDDIIASLRSENRVTKFMDEADMLLAFERDEELCLNAVCALYRQKFKNDGFCPLDSTSECALAKYLIDGDKELRLKRSVSQVKRQWPSVITQCRRLAISYVTQLFEIYCTGGDPLFCQQ